MNFSIRVERLEGKSEGHVMDDSFTVFCDMDKTDIASLRNPGFIKRRIHAAAPFYHQIAAPDDALFPDSGQRPGLFADHDDISERRDRAVIIAFIQEGLL